MRIRIRAWHTIQKKMYSPEEMAQDQMCLLPTGEFINVHSIPKFSQIDHSRVMISLLSTGLLDKNGKEIFEGDFVKWSRTGTIFRIDWTNTGWGVTRISGAYSYPIFQNMITEIEVIGNEFKGEKGEKE